METSPGQRSHTPNPGPASTPAVGSGPVASRSGRLGPLVGILLADVTCFAVVMPLLASYAASFGAGAAAIGGLVATYSLMHFTLAPFWGRVSDRFGRRPVLLIGLIGTLAGSLVFAAAGSFALLLLSRVVAGGMGATLNVAQAYAADESTPERRTRAMGLLGAAFGLGFILGPTIGAVTSRFGDAAPGLAAAAIAAVNLCVAWAALGEPTHHAPMPGVLPVRLLGPRGLLSPFVAAFCSTLAFTVIYVVFPLHAEQVLGFDRSRVGWLFALVGLVAAVVQGWVVGRLAPRFGEGRLVRFGGLAMGGGLAMLPAVAAGFGFFSPALFVIALALTGAGFGLTSPAEAGYVSRRSGPHDQGRAMGLLQSVNAMARIAGPVMAGVVMELGGAPAAFLVAAGAALGAAAAGAAMEKGLRTRG